MEKGFKKVTMKDIVEACEISRADSVPGIYVAVIPVHQCRHRRLLHKAHQRGIVHRNTHGILRKFRSLVKRAAGLPGILLKPGKVTQKRQHRLLVV